jgi:hypothetical protein
VTRATRAVFYIVHPYIDKPDRLLIAIVVRSFETAAESFAELGDQLHPVRAPGDVEQMLVVDEQRRPVHRDDSH